MQLSLLAIVHLAYTLHDLMFNPRYFSPRDQALLPRMRATRNGLTTTGRDYWSALFGFHLSHGLGVMMFALLIVLASTLQVDWLKALLVGLGVVYTGIAWHCWFHIRLIGCATATVLMAAAWACSRPFQNAGA